MEQIAGLAWVTGLPDGPPVAPRGACDPLAGAHAAFATLAALEFADRTGHGQLVEVPMIETVLNVTAVQAMEFEVFGSVMERRGTAGTPRRIRTSTDARVRTTGSRSACAPTMEAHRAGRRWPNSSATATSTSASWLANQDAERRAERLAEAGIPAAAVISPSLVTENPQLVHRGFFERLDHPRTGARPIRVRRSPASTPRPWLRRTPPTLGQHNEEVLTELCGLTSADLERLAADGVIGTRPKGA